MNGKEHSDRLAGEVYRLTAECKLLVVDRDSWCRRAQAAEEEAQYLQRAMVRRLCADAEYWSIRAADREQLIAEIEQLTAEVERLTTREHHKSDGVHREERRMDVETQGAEP